MNTAITILLLPDTVSLLIFAAENLPLKRGMAITVNMANLRARTSLLETGAFHACISHH